MGGAVSGDKTLYFRSDPLIAKHYHEKDFLEYLDAEATDYPLSCVEILKDFLGQKTRFTELFFNLELIRNILTKTRVVRTEPRIIQAVNIIVNCLGELGYYEFRDLLVWLKK